MRPSDFDELIRLISIAPSMAMEHQRIDLIHNVFVGENGPPTLDCSGSPGTAARRIGLALLRYGHLSTGQPALKRLIELLRTDFGNESLPRLDELTRLAESDIGDGPRPQVVMIYASEDRMLAETVAGDLSRAGFQPWVDVDGLHSADVWERTVRDGLEEASAAVLLVTPQAMRQDSTVRRDARLARDTGLPIFALIDAPDVHGQSPLSLLGVPDTLGFDCARRSPSEARIELLAVMSARIGGTGPAVAADTTLRRDAIRREAFGTASAKADVFEAYLRGWFGKPWAAVSLADFSDRNERVSLLDVYVPLPLDFSLKLKTEGLKIIDWWEDDKAENERRVGRPANPATSVEPRQKRRVWPSLGVGEVEIQAIVDGFEKKTLRRIDDDEEDYDEEDYDEEDYEYYENTEDGFYMEAHNAASVQPRFVLVGDPGSGKSSFARHLTLCMAGAQLREAGAAGVPANASLEALIDWLPGSLTPIYIELRHLVQEVFPALPENPRELPTIPGIEHFWTYIDRHVLGNTLLACKPKLIHDLNAGRALIVLDGLDEVGEAADPRRRGQVKSFVGALSQFGKSRIIVTSRPHAYRVGEWALDGFGRAELRPLFSSRLRELANALFKTLIPDRAKIETRAFFRALKDVPDDLQRSPLFFTLLAAIWLKSPGQHALPQTRGALYRQSLDLMLAKWTERKGFSRSVADMLCLKPDELRIALQVVACSVQGKSDAKGGTTEFHRRELVDIVPDLNKAPPETMWDYLEQRAGILVSGRSGYFRFAHRSFQEHLAACELTAPAPPRIPPVPREDAFPDGLIRRALEKPDLWGNVVRLAADELSLDRAHDLIPLLTELLRPYIHDSAPAANRETALMGIQIAREHGLIEWDGDEFSLRAPLTKALRKVCITLLTDLNLTTQQRLEAGRPLAALGDPRKGVGLIDMTGSGAGLPDIDWVPIPDDGQFTYGDKSEENGPVKLRLPAFKIGRYPITFVQFQAFLDAPDGFRNRELWEDLSANADHRRQPGEQAFMFANHPRENVNWFVAMAFCDWLTARYRAAGLLTDEKQFIRLPSELEWEKAARGRDGRVYPWGQNYIAGYANINETSSDAGPNNLQSTSQVGMYPKGASPYGVLDMSGNVREWCLNEYEKPQNFQRMGSKSRVVRGGSWFRNLDCALASYRFWFRPDVRLDDIGFRVVCGVAPVWVDSAR